MTAGFGTAAPDGDRERLAQRFRDVHGSVPQVWQQVLDLDPRFFEAALEMSAVPLAKDDLEPKVRELVSLAADVSATNLYAPGIRFHMRAALDHGATVAEVMEVLELTTTIGIHACNVGVPLLLQVLDEEGLSGEPIPRSARQHRLRQEFEANRGYWHEFWDGLLDLDADLFEAYMHLSSVPWLHGTLEPKVKELVYVAFDAATTHLYAPGLKLHLHNALRLGASVGEIMQVLDIVSLIGLRGLLAGAAALSEELESRAPRESRSAAPGSP